VLQKVNNNTGGVADVSLNRAKCCMGVLENVTVEQKGLQFDKRQFIQMPMVKVRKIKVKLSVLN
jgi:hypothetical protein